MTTARGLADRYHEEWLDAHPFFASELGIPGRDDRVPDDSEEGERRRRAQVEAVLADARRLGDAQLSPDDTITLGAVVSAAEQELSELDLARPEFTVTPMPFVGPASLLAVAARTVLPDAEAAENYLARLRLSGAWIDQLTERLRAGAAKGRLPVAHLSEAAIDWTSTVVALPVPEALRAPQPPQGWDGAAAWATERDAVAEEVVRPALIRWSDQARDLLPRSRSTGEVGLVHLPDGSADYERAILVHTTLPLTAEDLHRIGVEEVDRLEERCRQLGAELGLDTLDAVHRAMRESSAGCRSGGGHGRRRDCRAPSRACCGRVLPGAPAPGVRGHPDASPSWPRAAWLPTTHRPAWTALGRAPTGSTRHGRQRGRAGTSKEWPSMRPCPVIICSSPASSS